MSQANVMVHTLNEHDYIVLCRHYNGSGSLVNFTEVYVVREGKFLGRFNKGSEAGSFDWVPASEHKRQAEPKEVTIFLNHCRAMTAMAEKLWKNT